MYSTSDTPSSSRKRAIKDAADLAAPTRDAWIHRNAYFYAEDERYMRFLVQEDLKVLDLGCGTGRLLSALRPSRGVGIDISPAMIDIARRQHPELELFVGDVEDPEVLRRAGGPFDVIILSETIGYLDDCETALANLQAVCSRETRVVISYYSPLWEPLLFVAERAGQKMPAPPLNWLSTEDIVSLLELADYDIVKQDWRLLLPKRLLGLGPLVNRYLGTLPLLRRLSLRNYIVARPMRDAQLGNLSASIIIPCRNERGNIEAAVRRTPSFADKQELIFVEGGSEDGTYEEAQRVRDAYPNRGIKVLKQDGTGKGDAVRKGFHHATGEILMILDADLTVPPEKLPSFYNALISGKGNFINGTRLVYPLEREAMRFLNTLANHLFSRVFSWLLNERFTDTLCGTKVLTKAHYRRIEADRKYFGDFDPFGDFDLIFGAAKQNLKIVEIPVRYAARGYGETQIDRFRHGLLLMRMVVFAFRRLKAF